MSALSRSGASCSRCSSFRCDHAARIPADGRTSSRPGHHPGAGRALHDAARDMCGHLDAALMAIVAGGCGVCGLMIAFNLGVRFFSLLLIVGIIVATFYMDDVISTSAQTTPTWPMR